MGFKFPLQNKPLKTQIKVAFIVIVIFTSILPIIYNSIANLNTNLENEENENIDRLNGDVQKLTANFEATLTQLQVSFDAISSSLYIKDIVEYCATNETLVNDFEDLENKTVGDFYPQRLELNETYLNLIDFFLNNFENNEHIEMIRIFSENGNIIAGVVEGSEDVIDYKGGKSWFQDTLGITDENFTYTSPINLARRSGNPNIRFSIPIIINNESKGVFVINYNVAFLNSIFYEPHELTHFTIIIDPNYENAEGEFLGEVYIVNSLDIESCFNESNGGNIDFKENMFTSLSENEIGEITLNNTDYFFIFQKITFSDQIWYIAHLSSTDSFSESTLDILQHDITVLIITVILIIGLGVILSFVVSNTIVKNQEELKKAEEEVEHSGKILRTVFQAIPDEFVLFSHEGIYLESLGSEKMHFSNSESLIGKNCNDIMPKNVVKLKIAAVEKLFKTKESQIVEYSIQMPSGRKCVFESRLFYYSEEVYASITRDITEKKEAEGIILDFNKKLEKDITERTSDLKKISDKLQTIFETANEGFWELDNNNITIDVNPKMREILGKTKEEIIGKKVLEFLTPEGKEIIQYQRKEYRDKGISSSYEISLEHSNSEVVNCIINAAPIFDEFGKKIGSFGLISDITYLKEAEKKLKGQVEKLDILYEISSLLATPNILVEDLIQNSLPLILRASHNSEETSVRISYDEFEYKSENFRETEMKFSILEKINEKNLEINVFIPEEIVFSKEEINLMKEIQERIKIEILRREIDHQNFILANIVENSGDAIMSLKLDGTIISWNMGAELIFDYTTKEILGKNIKILTPSEQFSNDRFIRDSNINGKQITHFETKRLRKDGKLLDISLNVSPIKNPKGDITGVSAIGRDFTEEFEKQKLYQEQILKSSQFKSDFMAEMSHELRTPLNSIIGFTDVLLERFYGEINDKQSGYLSNVKTSAEHLLHLINDILDISKIEAGKMELDIEDIPLQNVLNQIEITLKPEIEKKHLKFELIGLNSEQVIHADLVRFKEIIFNLLSNAVKFTKEGMIKLEVIELEELWKFNMIDTGIGIKEEHFDTIFKEFARVQSAYVTSVEGTGLGLSLTKRLIELHGGNIDFTSKWDEGSTFTFTLPKKRRIQ